ncbi:hypothetical protein EE612_017026 [Oryza sativa]|nr:hypothetical protein EE612_017026 [Oryza sativa]
MPAVLDPACTATARRCSQTSCIFPSPFPMRHSPWSPPPALSPCPSSSPPPFGTS